MIKMLVEKMLRGILLCFIELPHGASNEEIRKRLAPCKYEDLIGLPLGYAKMAGAIVERDSQRYLSRIS